MDCFINRGIYVRANGSVRCGCDAGTHINLQPYDTHIDYAKDLYYGPEYEKIRRLLRQDRLPYKDVCSLCPLLLTTVDFDPSFADEKIVDLFQIEPSFACTLECPCCIDRKERKNILPKTEGGHLVLPLHVLKKILTDLINNGIKVRHFSLEGHGEPLMNRNIWKMLAMIRELYPEACISMTTNAHAVFKPGMLDARIDELVFSIDGMSQETYEPYRKRGNFNKAYQFMKDYSLAARERNQPVNTVWKYVIFEHNDKEDQLLRAQGLALEAGISKIVFIITYLGPHSKTISKPEHIPRLKNGPAIEVISNIMQVEEFEKRIYDICDELRNDDSDRGAETYLYVMVEHLLSGWEEGRLEQYNALKRITEETADMTLQAHGQILIAHDRLVRNNIFRFPNHMPKPDLMFDEAYYLAGNTDVAEAVASGVFKSGFEHYRLCGRAEGRRPYS